MMSQENITTIKNVYTAFNKWDIPGVLDWFAPTIEWVSADNSPLADQSPYRGLDSVRTGVFERIGGGFEKLTIRVDELFDGQDRVVMLGYYEGVWKASGKPFTAQVAHIWSLANGKVTKFQQYTDTYQLATSAK